MKLEEEIEINEANLDGSLNRMGTKPKMSTGFDEGGFFVGGLTLGSIIAMATAVTLGIKDDTESLLDLVPGLAFMLGWPIMGVYYLAKGYVLDKLEERKTILGKS